ncbi:MAG: hypothetical protein RJA70_3759 [Pseudomonadota bacterium]
MLNSPNVGLDQVARNIETDPALASKMLRLANSSLYRRGAPCDTVLLAVTRVGANAIYELVASIAVSKMYQSQTPAMSKLRSHCLGVAGISRFLAAEFGDCEPERAFLCGLLHDVGKILINQGGALAYDRVEPEAVRPGKSHLYERKHLGYDHAKLAAHALELWQVPEPIPSVVSYHHKPIEAYRAKGELASLVTVLCGADLLDYYVDANEELSPALARELTRETPLKRMNVDPDRLIANWGKVRKAKQDLEAIIDS